MLEKRLSEWVERVISAKQSEALGGVDTFQMVVDVDKIIAEEFGHEYVFEQNR
ncbi:hypothetical protein [Clostridium sp. D33t1_170424_F3]|uniref:hypothetical protein n=1 Tax=Clostridium sp. D33t1_170424_F3 TaxID=2787099 RepID=UPI0018AB1A14|nr:hypothetical protein [Clostridium sp. D33t1_170424_F3]